MSIEGDLKITVPGGGSGCISIEDSFLNVTPNVDAITHPGDNGKHSKRIRALGLGLCAPGDATNRMAVRIRDLDVRALFLHRWKLNNGHSIDGNRTINELLAVAEVRKKSHSEGIKLLEKAFRADYIGRVIPVTDDDIHLRAICEDGSEVDYEDEIDQKGSWDSPISKLRFIDKDGHLVIPRPNPEALESFAKAQIIFLPPTSLFTSMMPILETPGVATAIKSNKEALLVWVCPAFTNPETYGYRPADFADRICTVLDRRLNVVLLNTVTHQIPSAYEGEGAFAINSDNRDVERCYEYADRVVVDSFTETETIAELEVVRHVGQKVVDRTLEEYQQLASHLAA